MNLFEEAIKKNELLDFALGKDDYFIADRDYGDHSIINSWNSYILPLIEIKGNDYVSDKIEEMISEVLNCNTINEQEKNESILYHLHVYYYLNNEEKIQAKSLSSLNYEIKSSLNEYVDFLNRKNDPKENAIRNAMKLIESRRGLSTRQT